MFAASDTWLRRRSTRSAAAGPTASASSAAQRKPAPRRVRMPAAPAWSAASRRSSGSLLRPAWFDVAAPATGGARAASLLAFVAAALLAALAWLVAAGTSPPRPGRAAGGLLLVLALPALPAAPGAGSGAAVTRTARCPASWRCTCATARASRLRAAGALQRQPQVAPDGAALAPWSTRRGRSRWSRCSSTCSSWRPPTGWPRCVGQGAGRLARRSTRPLAFPPPS